MTWHLQIVCFKVKCEVPKWQQNLSQPHTYMYKPQLICLDVLGRRRERRERERERERERGGVCVCGHFSGGGYNTSGCWLKELAKATRSVSAVDVSQPWPLHGGRSVPVSCALPLCGIPTPVVEALLVWIHFLSNTSACTSHGCVWFLCHPIIRLVNSHTFGGSLMLALMQYLMFSWFSIPPSPAFSNCSIPLVYWAGSSTYAHSVHWILYLITYQAWLRPGAPGAGLMSFSGSFSFLHVSTVNYV